MKQLLRNLFVAVIVMLLGGCAMPQIDSPWKERSYQTWPPQDYGNCPKVY